MKKIIKRISFGIGVFPLVLTLSSCFLAEKEKEFNYGDIHITLDNTFFKRSMEDATVVFTSSKNINIFFYESEMDLATLFTNIDSEYELYSITENTDYAVMKNKGSIHYYEFYYLLDENKIYTLITAFEDYLCEVQMGFNESNEVLYTETVFDWLESVEINKN